ncbi:MAG TPA: GntR family transcriptional regulator [candidate division Zixibacteria bacterium]|nr:GntR family transcriptional regulator [candidate division Zixibacteria bacterium]
MDKLEQYLASQPTKLTDDSSRLRREIAYVRLKDALQHADLEPGEVLSETRLSESLGISRTPVREALRQLAQEGLVQIIPGRAITVASHSLRSILNVVHIRLLLEPELVRLTTGTLSSLELDRLIGAVRDMEESCEQGDQTAWSRADTRFHEILGEACPNQLLGEIVTQMRNRAHHLANIDSQTNPSRLQACTTEHREIVNSIVDKDGLSASETTRIHIEKLRESLFSRLSYG